MVKAVLVGIKALRKIRLTCGTVMQKFGADLEDVASEAFVLRIGYLMGFVLIDNENIVVVNIIDLTAYKKAFAARDAKEYLAAIVDMYVRIGISILGIINSEACIVAGVGNCSRAAFKYVFHKKVSLSFVIFMGDKLQFIE